MTEKKLTVVMPLKNSLEYIDDTIYTLSLQCDLQSLLVHIIDESDDGITDRYVKKALNKYKVDYKYDHFNGMGFDECLLYGFNSVNTEYASFFTFTDLLFDPEYTNRAVHFLDNNPMYSYFHTNILSMPAPGIITEVLRERWMCIDENTKSAGFSYFANYLCIGGGVNELVTVYRTTALKDLCKQSINNKGFRYNRTYGLLAYLFYQGYLGYYSPRYSVIGRVHPDSLSSQHAKEKQACSIKAYEELKGEVRTLIQEGKMRFRLPNGSFCDDNLQEFGNDCIKTHSELLRTQVKMHERLFSDR